MNNEPESQRLEPAQALPGDQRPVFDVVAAEVASHPAYDPFNEEVLLQLNQRKQRSWLQTVLVLGFSLLLFGFAGLVDYGGTELLLLIAVLLFHEGGHYLGMRLFGYQDVQMFFIPFFGAAVSGRKHDVAGYKEAIVILLGPMPGILLGVVVGIVAWVFDNAIARSAATMLLVVNGFNLLPFLPLDGGRLLNLTLFSRQRHLEAIFRCVTGGLLGLIGVALGAWLLGIVGVMMIFSTGVAFRIRSLSQELRATLAGPAVESENGEIPRGQAMPIIDRVRQAFPQSKAPKTVASLARQVWDQLRTHPPGVLATLALLAAHGFGLFGSLIVFGVFSFPIRTVSEKTDAQGNIILQEEVRIWGRLDSTTEIPDQD